MDQPIEMPFGLWAGMGLRNQVLDGGPDPPMGKGNFEREMGRSIMKYMNLPAKTAEPIEMPFGMLSCSG